MPKLKPSQGIVLRAMLQRLSDWDLAGYIGVPRWTLEKAANGEEIEQDTIDRIVPGIEQWDVQAAPLPPEERFAVSQERAAKLEQERDALQRELERIHSELRNEMESTSLSGLGIVGDEDGTSGVSITPSPGQHLSQLMARQFYQTLKETGGKNYVEIVLEEPESGDRISVTVRYLKPGTKTPSELREAAEAEVVRLRETIRVLTRAEVQP